MLDRLSPGSVVDGFRVGERIHSGAMGHILSVTREGESQPLLMKVPRIGPGESAEGLISFETEAMILPALSGPHVPRCYGCGDITTLPYLVIEHLPGESLAKALEAGIMPPERAAAAGAAIADALQSVHEQHAIHLDLKPDNVILRPDGTAALIDFGLAHHERFPDLLAEEMRYASGSAPYVSPEQILLTRSDPRSDIFALGVVLYEMVTGELPFGIPATLAGMRDRLWKDPAPPSAYCKDMPPWLQEVILRCIEPRAQDRYQSAAHVAFDLRQPDQVRLTERATKARQDGVLRQVGRWWGARGAVELAPPESKSMPPAAPVIMVAVDTMHPDDARQPEIKRVTAQVLSLSKEFRLICVSVIRAGPLVESPGKDGNASSIHLEHMIRLRHWAESLGLPPRRLSLHVLESASSADTLLGFARSNHVNLIILGAPGPDQHTLAWWRSVASSVTANAHCSVHLVRVPERGAAAG
ncbi:MAG: bifunctional serine/threonine-protein kinase/universal stress protein [Betaproteobacteria bacterium]